MRRGAVELGIKVYLVKPIGQSDLLDGILNALGTQILDSTSPVPCPTKRRRPCVRCGCFWPRTIAVNSRLATARSCISGAMRSCMATNGREALDLLEASGFKGFDAVLMDVQMPEMDGMEATAAIRARERTLGTHLPIIGVTAHAMKGDRERCLEGGMDGYVSKPIRPDILFSELVRLVPAAAPQETEPHHGFHGSGVRLAIRDRFGSQRSAGPRRRRHGAAGRHHRAFQGGFRSPDRRHSRCHR